MESAINALFFVNRVLDLKITVQFVSKVLHIKEIVFKAALLIIDRILVNVLNAILDVKVVIISQDAFKDVFLVTCSITLIVIQLVHKMLH